MCVFGCMFFCFRGIFMFLGIFFFVLGIYVCFWVYVFLGVYIFMSCGYSIFRVVCIYGYMFSG